jgi:NADH-quinone oxidoreductase subunit J
VRWHPPALAAPTPAAGADATPLPHVAAVGMLLFTEFALPFEVVSLVLLVAILGAVVVARRKTAS